MEGIPKVGTAMAEEGSRVASKALRAVDRPLPEASTLPGPLFSDPGIYLLEMRRLFQRSWQCIGRVEELPRPGDYLTTEVGGSGVVLVRGLGGEVRAFHNVCRHRGTRLLEAAAGSGLGAIRCPYHAWTYDLEGLLLAAPHMEEIQDFDRKDYGLHGVRLETWRGFIFVNLDPRANPLGRFLGDFVHRAAPYPLERLRRAHRVIYDIAANWKLVVQNADECYHCAGVHPQLHRITPYLSGGEDMTEGPIFGGWMDLNEGYGTLTMDGKSLRAPFPGLSAQDRRRVYYYFLYPGNFFSLLPDYITWDRFIPLGPERTRLIFDVYVDRDVEGPAEDALDFWETTNRQDWHICELAHLGSKTAGYVQGRYSQEEELVHAIDRYYLQRMGLLRKGGGRRALREKGRGLKRGTWRTLPS